MNSYRSLCLIALPVALTATASFAFAGDMEKHGVAFGDSAPMATAKMLNVDGRELSIADVTGEKGTLVFFSCNGCPWVKAWEDRMVDLGNRYQKKGIGFIVINSNDPARNAEDGFDVMKTRVKEKGYPFPYVVDATSDVARAFAATRTPEAFLFNSEGKLVYHGAIDDNGKDPTAVDAHYLRDALEAVTNGGKIAVKETKSIGCSIKFRGSEAPAKS